MKKTLSLTIFGQVQGVNYRYYARKKAADLKLVGWVKNNRDGTVYIIAEGDEQGLTEFVNWCRSGPPAAQVSKINIEWSVAKNIFKTFEIKYNNL